MSRSAVFGFIAAEKTTNGVRRLCRGPRGQQTGGPADAPGRYGGHPPAPARQVRPLHALDRDRRGPVERNFTAAAPDRLWVADITYLRTWEGFLYLAVVIDACTRKVVGWAMADHLRTKLVLDTVGMALFARRPAPGLVHHSDRGSQYTAYEFGKTLRTSGLLASVGRVGSAFDNALAESFFATLKAELVYRRAWPTRDELEMEVVSYIEGFYNPRRRHSRLDNLSPADFEQMLTIQNEASA